MSGVPKNKIMTPDEMRATETRAGRLYSQTADHGMVVTAIVSNLAAELAARPKKIDIRNSNMVSDVAVAYVDACARAGTMPNKTGLCRAMGMTRQGVDHFMHMNPGEPSAELLQMIFDSFAEALSAASLASAVHPIVSIFLLKAISGYSDTLKIEAAPPRDPLGNRQTAESIAARYTDLLRDVDLPD